MTQDLSAVDLRRLHDQQIRAWFGEVRPLRLEGSGKLFTPPPALPLRAVFVPPALSATYFQPTASEAHLGGGNDVMQWFSQQRRLVVLGDPGSGKSTLVSWLAWRLCAGLTERLPDWADGAVPVPMILRDMQLESIRSFDDLLAAYLRTDVIAGHPALEQHWGRHLQGLIESQPGSVLFLIDGLDELSQATRDKVRDAIRDGMTRLDRARFMVTSRIVGYEQCAIEILPLEALAAGPEAVRLAKAEAIKHAQFTVYRLYVMPFDNGRIRQFARNWFEHGETEDRRGADYLEKFVDGVMRDPVALQLARTPNLLVMAAQVFGITNTLPDGRAKLYEAITKAYLESIDKRYGLLDQRYSLEQKKAWLAAVGYQMQTRRSEDREDSDEGARDLLVDEAEVIAWLSEAMRESGLAPDAAYVSNFVDAIARRSGLFIPRGEGQYAFAHLSIQEYFAALHLQNSVRDHAVSDPVRLKRLFKELAKLGSAPAWREALVTFFELPEWSPKVITTLFQTVFGKELERVPEVAKRQDLWDSPENAAVVETLARLVVNPGIALPGGLRERGVNRALAYLRSERQGSKGAAISGVLGALTVNDEGSRRIWQMLKADPGLLSGSESVLDLRGARMVDFSPLSGFTAITKLLANDTLIADLSPLAGLVQLTHLDLERTPVQSLAPLSSLHALQTLDLSQTQVNDLSPLASLTRLTDLSLIYTPVRDVGALSNLRGLRDLNLQGTEVDDLTPLQGLTSLVQLLVAHTRISDLKPLSSLKSLRTLDLDHSQVADLSGLERLHIEALFINNTLVSSLQPLANVATLSHIMLMNTPVSDLSALADLTSLVSLFVSGSQVRDISPLSHLSELVIEGGPDGPNKKPKRKTSRRKVA